MEICESDMEIRGRTIRYLTAGSGTPMVLLHGNEDSARDWQWVLPDLARRYRVLAPDLPGFGAGDRTKGDYSSAGLTEFVAGFVDGLDLPRAIVVGNSLGGRVALDYALNAPGRVEALVLVDAAGLGAEIDTGSKVQTLPFVGEWSTTLAGTPPVWLLRLGGRIK
jgi:pimeloyl-ACP methyl ester carboxylesterase